MNNVAIVENKNVLASAQGTDVATIFKANGTDPLLQAIEDEVAGHVPDVTTAKGRKEVIALAAKVTKSKTFLDGLGKTMADELNAKLKPINSERKKARDHLDALAKKVRKPVTDWENEQQAIAEAAKQVINDLYSLAVSKTPGGVDLTAEQMKSNLAKINDYFTDSDEAADAKSTCYDLLGPMIQTRIRYESDQAELQRLKDEKDARDQKDREDEIARNATKKAEDEAAQKVKDAEIEAATAKINSANAVKRAAEEAEAAKKQAVINEAAAVEKERREVAHKAQVAADALQALADDREHRGKVHRSLLDDFVAHGIPAEHAKKMITVIAGSNHPHIKIEY